MLDDYDASVLYTLRWLMEWTEDIDACVDKVRHAKREAQPLSIGYLGNIVDIWYNNIRGEFLTHCFCWCCV